MIGNSLVPILTSNNDQGFIITASREEASAYKVFANGGWSAGYSAGTQWINILFPKYIKLTKIEMLPGNSFSGVNSAYSKNQIQYLTFAPNVEHLPVVAKSIKLYLSTANGYYGALGPVKIYGFCSPGKFLMKTINNYIYNNNSTDINSTTIESINSNNTLPEFIEECSSDINNINGTFSVIKIVK